MRHRRHRLRSKSAWFLGAVTLLMLAALSSSPGAQAQISCDAASSYWQVSNATEFNAAVDCHNVGLPGTSNILLLNDIAATTLAGDVVFEPIMGGDLVIIGDGHTLSRAGAAGTDPAPILSFQTDSSTVVGLLQLGIEVGPFDSAAIEHTGSGFVDLSVVSISAGASGSTATGLVASAPVALRYSLIDGLPVGIQASSTSVNVVQSTISSTVTDMEQIGDVSAQITNATLGGPVGITFDGGLTKVDNSTIFGDGAQPSATVGEGSYVMFRSSIVNVCTAAETLDVMPGPGWVDSGNNAGACFAGGETVALSLADNGCDRRTPTGCPHTAEIQAVSPARDVGLCGDLDTTEFDQRGAARTPIGAGCDAGSYEFGCDPEVEVNETVSTGEEFAAAILCHNLGPASSTIELANDITAVGLADYGAAFPLIGRGQMFVLGNGYSIGGSTPLNAGPVLGTSGDVELYIFELQINIDDSNYAGIQHTGNESLRVHGSSILALSDATLATGIVTSPDAHLFEMTNSTIEGLPTGVRVSSSVGIVENSTIVSTEVDVAWESPGIGGIFNSTLAGPVGIELYGAGLHVENTTIVGDGAALSAFAGEFTFVTFKSSIVGSCSADEAITETQPGPVWVDFENNAGACFDPANPVELLVGDNGCAAPTPSGCAPTAYFLVPSPAFQAGNCEPGRVGTNEFDQRGEPRTPAGLGCDAGSFESTDLPPGDVTGNGIVDNADVLAILVWLAGGDEPPALAFGDVAGGPNVGLDDALNIAQQAVDVAAGG